MRHAVRITACALATSISLAGPCGASETTSDPNSASESTLVDALVVHGYRASLRSALAAKRADSGIVEVIDAEDVADFPDMNLAESLQRVAGVAIDRDGGEGRSITVRGLSADFTRVRIDGMEALATSGGKDLGGGGGGANRGRGFDFQIFASELFNRVTVRKSQSARVEEGSLGATVDLQTALPFDYDGFTAVGGVQYGYNDLSRRYDPRGSVLLSGQWADGRIGALVSAAYSARRILEEGSGSGRWENPSVATNSGGCFASPGPCNAATGSYSAVNSAWHARSPRYQRLAYDWERLGLTAALQIRPDNDTLITVSGLYADMSGDRREDYLEIYLNRQSRGMDHVNVRNAVIDDKNQLIAATFDGVDVRAESRHDVLKSRFQQASIEVERRFGERLRVTGAYGDAKSIQDNPVQTSLSFDRYDTRGYSYDFSGGPRRPAFNYGFDVTDPAAWAFSASNALGDASLLRMRPNKTVNRIVSTRLDADFTVNPSISLKTGVALKRYDFATREQRRYAQGGITDGAVALPAGVTLSDIAHLVGPIGSGLDMPAGTPTTWLAPDIDKVVALLGIDCNCINAYGDFRVSTDNQRAANREVSEHDVSGYAQMDFHVQAFDMPLRGDVGVRYARTRMNAGGFVGTEFVRLRQTYDDVLPALNLVLEPRENLLLRFGAAKVMARPQLPYLTPGGTINNQGRTLTVGNPGLAPIRANTFDLNLEWYPQRGTLLSAGLFFKDLRSYIQSSTATLAYGATGFPTSLLSNGNTNETLFEVSTYENTAGGELKGYELSIQKQFSFLPAPFDRFGGIANYTRVASTVDYITDSAAVPPVISSMDLIGLSPSSWNATLYYEGKRLSARASAAYRDGYIGSVPGGNGNDARGKAEALTVDAVATFKLSERATATIEGLNLTDVFDERWISTTRMSSEEFSHTGRQVYIGLRYRF